MYTEYKYVMVKDMMEVSWPVLLPMTLNHSTIPKHLATSAGFAMRLADGTWKAYGRSMTLNLDSRPVEDSVALTMMYGNTPHE